MDILTASVVVAGLSVGIGTIGTAIGQGLSVAAAMNGIARQPEAAGSISTNLIIGLAFIESLMIYALVVALLLLFADPLIKPVQGVADAKAKVELIKLETERIQAQAQLDALQAPNKGQPSETK